VVYFGRVSRFKPLSWIVKAYISIMRGTPLMLQLLLWYFGPFYLWGMNIGGYKFTAIILGCSLNYAAYFAEIYRSGIESIPSGQYEAAQLLGYNKSQTFFKIVLPQVVKIVLPSVTNEVITLVKDTSLVFCILYRDVCTCKTDRGSTDNGTSVCDRRCVLLHFQLCGCMGNGMV